MVSAENHVSGRFWVVLQVCWVPGTDPYIPDNFSISSWRSQRPEVSRRRGLGALFDSCSTRVRLVFDSGGGRNGARTQTLTVHSCWKLTQLKFIVHTESLQKHTGYYYFFVWAMFDSCSTRVRLVFDSYWCNRVEQEWSKATRSEQSRTIGVRKNFKRRSLEMTSWYRQIPDFHISVTFFFRGLYLFFVLNKSSVFIS